VRGLLVLIRQTDEREGRALFRVPDTFDGRDLGGLMFERIESMQVIDENLHGRDRWGRGRSSTRKCQQVEPIASLQVT